MATAKNKMIIYIALTFSFEMQFYKWKLILFREKKISHAGNLKESKKYE